MKYAFNCNEAIPSKSWLATTGLIWEKIYVSGWGKNFTDSIVLSDVANLSSPKQLPQVDPRSLSDQDLFKIAQQRWDKKGKTRVVKDVEFFLKLIYETDIIEIKDFGEIFDRNQASKDNLDKSSWYDAKKLADKYKERDDAFKKFFESIEKIHKYKSEIDKIFKANPNQNESSLANYGKDFERLHNKYIRSGINFINIDVSHIVFLYSPVLNKYSQASLFFRDKESFSGLTGASEKAIFSSAKAYLPCEPESLEINQIKDFREKTKMQRLRFKSAFSEIVEFLEKTSTEEDLRKNVRLAKEFIDEQVESTKDNYKKTKILARATDIGYALTGAGAIYSSLGSMMLNPIISIASIIPLWLANKILVRDLLEKAERDQKKDTWGYLLSVKDI